MKRIHFGEQVFLGFAAGVLFGTVISSRMFGSGLVSYSLLYEYLVQGWSCGIDGGRLFLWKILSVRLGETVLLVGLARSRIKRALLFSFSVWIGICASVLLAILTWSLGAAGIFCFLISIFPHMIVYLTVWGILIQRYRTAFEINTRKFWCMILCLTAFGITAEILINPHIMDLCKICLILAQKRIII